MFLKPRLFCIHDLTLLGAMVSPMGDMVHRQWRKRLEIIAIIAL
jgi:hypothetical protein